MSARSSSGARSGHFLPKLRRVKEGFFESRCPSHPPSRFEHNGLVLSNKSTQAHKMSNSGGIPLQSDPRKGPLLFEHATAVLGLSGATVLMLSVCFDFWFFLALGLRLHEVPTNIGDHVRTGIIWGPGLALVLFLSSASSASSLEWSRRQQSRHWTVDWVMPALVVLFALGFVIYRGAFFLLFGAVLLAWIPWSMHLLRLPVARALLAVRGRLLLVLLPALVIMVSGYAFMTAELMLLRKQAAWIVTFQQGDKQEVVPVRGLRRLTSVIVVIDVSGRVIVRPDAAVADVRRTDADLLVRRPLGCDWFGVFCTSP
jgi:hypothetical protein